MGSKGSQTTTNTNQAQTYTADQMVRNSGAQALHDAQAAASQPFQMPVAPVAGFSQDQQGAFNAYRNMQGSFNPYAQQASQAFGRSATPITAGDVSQYYNPMVDSITRQMQNIYGQQNAQNTGNLVQSAGGVGADRIAVGQANLSREQDLAAGQTYAGLYQNALQQAQQQKQMEAGAGSGFLNTGTALNSANLANTNAYLQSGQLQQQQAQAQLNAPYQNTLARIAYPFQTAQYLAGITGSLAPAFGGTTTGSQYGVTTPPTPSALSQIAGVGTAGVGLYGALNGGFGGSPSYGGGSMFSGDAYGGNSASPLPGLDASDYGSGYAQGGDVSPSRGDPEEPRQIAVQTLAPPDIHPMMGGATARRGMAHLPESHHDMLEIGSDTIYNRRGLHRADGGGADDADVSIPGISKSEAADLTPIPLSPMHASGAGGHSGPLTGAMNFPSPQQQNQGKSDSVLGDIAGIAGSVAKIAPLFMLARGGVASYGSGGGDDTPDDSWSGMLSRAYDYWTSPAAAKPTPTAPPDSFTSRYNGTAAQSPYQPTLADAGNNRQAGIDKLIQATTPAFRIDPGNRPTGNPKNMPPGVKANPDGDDEPMPPSKVYGRTGDTNGPAAVKAAMMPSGQQPYPDALDRDWGQQASRSPWLALVSAGAKMASTPGPLGVSIGQGLQAGVGTLDNQRKELTTEEGLNQKAQALYQSAKAELDKYSRMTPYEAGSLAARNKEIDQTGAGVDGKPGKPVTELDIQRYIKGQTDPLAPGAAEFRALPPEDQRRRAYMAIMEGRRIGQTGIVPAASEPDGRTPASPRKDPGENLRVPGLYYRLPNGQVLRWR